MAEIIEELTPVMKTRLVSSMQVKEFDIIGKPKAKQNQSNAQQCKQVPHKRGTCSGANTVGWHITRDCLPYGKMCNNCI